jgi:hypothetical protein
MGKGGLSHKTCGLIYDFEAYSFQSFMTSLEIVLAIRGDPVLFLNPKTPWLTNNFSVQVYATFNRNKFVAVLLAIVVIFDTAFNVVIPITTSPHTKFNTNCVATNHPAGLGWLT